MMKQGEDIQSLERRINHEAMLLHYVKWEEYFEKDEIVDCPNFLLPKRVILEKR